MIFNTKGIVLHKMDYSETSVIARVFTEELGMQSFIFKGAKKGKNKQSTMLHPFSLLDMVVYQKEGQSLGGVKEISRAHHFTSMLFDVEKSTVALFLAEVLFKTIAPDYKNVELFTFVSNAIQVLDLSEYDPEFHLKFLLQLSRFYGFYPNTDKQGKFFDLEEGTFKNSSPQHANFLDEKSTHAIGVLLKTSLHEPIKERLQITNRIDLLESLIRYYALHLENMKEIKSLEVLTAVFRD